MSRRRLAVVNLILVLTLIVPSLFIELPYDAAPNQAQATTSDSGPGGAGEPELANKRAKVKRERRQDRRRDERRDGHRSRAEGRVGSDQVRRPEQAVRSLRVASAPRAEQPRADGPQGAVTVAGSAAECEILQAKEERGELAGPVVCTHGPDPAPPGVDASKSVPLLSEAEALEIIAPKEIACVIGPDNTTIGGNRTRVLYLRAVDKPDRFQASLPTIYAALSAVDLNFRTNSYATGALRNVRFWQDPDTCLPYIEPVVVSATGDDNFQNAVAELNGLGLNRTDRIYLVFFDAPIPGICGQGSISSDDSAAATNLNNTGPAYALVYSGCWSGRTPTHELMHNLGGVQHSAPYASGGYHCIDEWDIMCYKDSAASPAVFTRCPDGAGDVALLDCGRDAYFNTNPAPGSYLATHWNPSTNQFLTTAAFPPPLPPVVSPPPPLTSGVHKHKKKVKKKPKKKKRKH